MHHFVLVLVGTLISILATQAMFPRYIDQLMMPRHVIVGQQLRDISVAAYNYVRERVAEVDDLAQAAGGVTTIEVSTLVTAMKLGPGTSATTLNGQTIRIVVRRISEGVLQGVVKGCGGDAFNDADLRAIAPYAASEYGMPGFILEASPTNVSSLGPGRTLTASNFSTASCPAAAGQPAVLLFWDGSDTPVATFLNRYQVPLLGSEPNRMRTDLFVDGCNDSATPYVDGCNIRGARALDVTRGIEFQVNGVTRWRLGPDASGNLVLTRLNASGTDIGSTVTFNLGNNSTTFASDFYGPYYGYSASDPVLKNNWAPINSTDLATVMSIRPMSFDYVADGRPGVGFNAEDVEKKLPLAVARDPVSEKLTVAYQALIPFHHQQLKNIGGKLQRLNEQLRTQQETIDRLRAALDRKEETHE